MIAGALLCVFLFAGLCRAYAGRQANLLYGTYSLNGSRDTCSAFLTLPGGESYVRYRDGELISQGTIHAINEETPLYGFLPEGGTGGEVFVLSGGVLYQALGRSSAISSA